jgi:SAM-dependent methyltransferase
VACSAQHWQPLVHPGREYYEAEPMAIYAEIHEQSASARVDPRHQYFVERFGGQPGRVLDAGCGNGAFLSELTRYGFEPWGFDIDGRSVSVAHTRGLYNVRQCMAPEFFKTATERGLWFDVVVALDVVEHVTDPVAFVRLLLSRLRPGGRFFMTVPNRERMLASTMKIDFPPHHFLRFDAAAAGHLLSSVGLSAVEVESFQYGYVGRAALEVLRTRWRAQFSGVKSGIGNSSVGNGSVGNGEGAKRAASAGRGLRAVVSQQVRQLLDRGSAPIEQALGRGYKLAATGVLP